jgi:hypothetical protein
MVLRSLENDMGYEPLTGQQRALAVELREALDSNDRSDPSPSTLEGPFHALCVALFCRMNYDDRRSEHGMEECPVYRFLVFASLRPSEHGGGFEPAGTVTQICARLMFSIRLVVYHEISQQMAKDKLERAQQDVVEENVPAAAADNDRHWKARIEERDEQWLEFVREDKCTPFAAVHNISQLAKAAAGSEPSGMPQIIQPGYSFLDDPSNDLQPYKRCLLQAFLASPLIAGKFITNWRAIERGGGDIEYNQSACRAWLQKTGGFLDMLATLMHIGGGQPARAEELATVRIRNTSLAHRGVYYINDTIMLYTKYHKSRSAMGSDKAIARFLPKNVASLLLQYLVIVRPLEL